MTARYVGLDAEGDPLFDIDLTIPDPVSPDIRATDRMIEAVTDLFGDLGPLTASQAHAILAARDYGRQCVDRLLPRSQPRLRQLLGQLVVAFILADDGRRGDVLAWSDRRFGRQADGSAVARTKRFAEVSDWLSGVIYDARLAGAAI